jgi:hypothetical protein
LRIAPTSLIFLFSKLSIVQVEPIDTRVRWRLSKIDHSETTVVTGSEPRSR